MLILKNIVWKTAKSGCWRNCNMKRTWISCLLDSSLNDAWQFYHVPSCKRIQLSFAWKQHPVSTHTIWWTPTRVFADDNCPLAEDVEKQLNVAFAMMKASHCCFGCWSLTGEFVDAHCWWQMPTGWWICPLAASLMLSRLSVWQPLVNFIDIFPPLSAERRDNLLQIYLNSPPLGVGEFHYCTPSFNCMRVPSSVHCWLHYVWL